ncbi:hypothetical protein B0H14DRAFT_3450760 [Mycena olivaceomarginata]|nr:hypothetical protein B0H14DRAFT_3450760 [Mycena olivaceomarginata]
MEEHLAQAHPEYASPRNPEGDKRLPHAVWISMKTSGEEEKALGIPVDKTPVPFSHVAGPDEGAEELQLGLYGLPVSLCEETTRERWTEELPAGKGRRGYRSAGERTDQPLA